jgi:sugar/nucleoside kinase (ribokinase family)
VIAVIGQSVVDRIKVPGEPWVERLGGAPLFAAQALAAAGADATILTRGATPDLRRRLRACGLPVIEGPSTRSCVSEMELYHDGTRTDAFVEFGQPFTPADVHGWMSPGLRRARAIVCGAQWAGDFPAETLAALAGLGRPIYLDGQGPLRVGRPGPIALRGPLAPDVLQAITVLKLAEEEAAAALGSTDPGGARALGIPVVAVTLAERGAVIVTDTQAVHVGVEPVLGLADTVGAGDAFLALMAAACAGGASPVEGARGACAGVATLLRRRLDGAGIADGTAPEAAGGSPSRPQRSWRRSPDLSGSCPGRGDV